MIQIKPGHRAALIQCDWSPYKKRDEDMENDCVRTQERMAIYTPQREASGGTSLAHTFSLVFSLQDQEIIN